MTVFEVITLMLTFGALIVALLDYIDKHKKQPTLLPTGQARSAERNLTSGSFHLVWRLLSLCLQYITSGNEKSSAYDVIIGGPPCHNYSSSSTYSKISPGWHSSTLHNAATESKVILLPLRIFCKVPLEMIFSFRILYPFRSLGATICHGKQLPPGIRQRSNGLYEGRVQYMVREILYDYVLGHIYYIIGCDNYCSYCAPATLYHYKAI